MVAGQSSARQLALEDVHLHKLVGTNTGGKSNISYAPSSLAWAVPGLHFFCVHPCNGKICHLRLVQGLARAVMQSTVNMLNQQRNPSACKCKIYSLELYMALRSIASEKQMTLSMLLLKQTQ